jgi:hypothetical protein
MSSGIDPTSHGIFVMDPATSIHASFLPHTEQVESTFRMSVSPPPDLILLESWPTS